MRAYLYLSFIIKLSMTCLIMPYDRQYQYLIVNHSHRSWDFFCTLSRRFIAQQGFDDVQIQILQNIPGSSLQDSSLSEVYHGLSQELLPQGSSSAEIYHNLSPIVHH